MRVRKRDGKTVKFDQERITDAIFNAALTVGGKDRKLSKELSDQVVRVLEEQTKPKEIPSVEHIQDVVEKVIIENGYAKTAKAYILYRQKRAQLRKAKTILGVEDDLKLSLNAITVLTKRHLKKNKYGKLVETPRKMFRRVAKAISSADKYYKKSNKRIKELEEEFFRMMSSLEFLPNSPTLMNAGTPLAQLSACYVLPIDDSIESIFDTMRHAALVQKSGGGIGFSFSKLRPAGDVVKTTGGIAAGPIFFINAFDSGLKGIKQGFKRYSTNMGILNVDHPDILDFIMAKEREGVLSTFNLSVGITDKFMQAIDNDEDFDLISPHGNRSTKRIKARAIWNLLITMAWKNGEPGVVFLDTINKHNPTPHIGNIESTNPCGEQPLLPYESCNLGSINLIKMTNDGKIDWEKLRQTVRLAVHFLDNVIDVNKYPIKELRDMARANRKIGLGVMGFSDMLIKLGIPYNSEEGVKLAGKVQKLILEEGRKMSVELGKKRGSFPNFKGSVWDKKGFKYMRNATITTVAPTSNLSIIAGCSSGIEPLFAVAYLRNVAGSLGENLIETNPLFEKAALVNDFYSEELMKKILSEGSIQEIEEIPEDIRRIFVTAHDISPEWHIRMQAAFQRYTDNAVSKTVNFSNRATPDDIEKVFKLAHELGCKGVTVYRDGSRQMQIIKRVKSSEKTEGTGPIIVDSDYSGGCPKCKI